jgi:hypothetical protein
VATFPPWQSVSVVQGSPHCPPRHTPPPQFESVSQATQREATQCCKLPGQSLTVAHSTQLPATQCAAPATHIALEVQATAAPAPAAPEEPAVAPPRPENPPKTPLSGASVPAPPAPPAGENRSIEPVAPVEHAASARLARLRVRQRLEDDRFGFIARKPVRIVCQIAARLSNRLCPAPAAIERAEAIHARILHQRRVRIARQ